MALSKLDTEQARSQVLRFGGKCIFRMVRFCYYCMFETNY